MELAAILEEYDSFIVDLWGVVHDGSALYPGVAEVLAYLYEQKKPVVFLSNAPRVSAKAQATLDKLSIAREHYVEVVTSGQVAHDGLKRSKEFSRYYYLGPGKDEDILADLPAYKKVGAEEAEFVLNTGYEADFQPHEEVIPTLEKLLARQLPLLCVNPDMEVVKQDGTRMLCAGALAAEYARLGGKVTYVGKPYEEVYEVCKALLNAKNILAIGDNPDTDIEGARRIGLDSLLITGGILAKRGEFTPKGATYVLPAFQF